MDPRELVDIIDREMDARVDEGWGLDGYSPERALFFYGVGSKHSSVVGQYVDEVRESYSRAVDGAVESAEKLGYLPKLISTLCGAGIGVLIGMPDDTLLYAYDGAVIGLITEAILSPSTRLISRMLVNYKLKQFEGQRKLCRDNALVELGSL